VALMPSRCPGSKLHYTAENNEGPTDPKGMLRGLKCKLRRDGDRPQPPYNNQRGERFHSVLWGARRLPSVVRLGLAAIAPVLGPLFRFVPSP
jgi:hypothetical protein